MKVNRAALDEELAHHLADLVARERDSSSRGKLFRERASLVDHFLNAHLENAELDGLCDAMANGELGEGIVVRHDDLVLYNLGAATYNEGELILSWSGKRCSFKGLEKSKERFLELKGRSPSDKDAIGKEADGDELSGP